MTNLRPFQIVLLAGSAFMFVAAIVAITVYKPNNSADPKFSNEIEIWGTLPKGLFAERLNTIANEDSRFNQVSYEQFDESVFADEFINALAESRGPDLVVITHDQLVDLRPKLFPIAYTKDFNRRNYQDLYVEGSEIFARPDGIYALPFAVDPLVMYWNRDVFSSNNIPVPPRTWEELRNDTVPRLTRTGGAFDIFQSAVAFGEYQNVRNAKEIISLLMLQAGSDIVVESDATYRVIVDSFTDNNIQGSTPASSALSFYTEFSNPASSLYSWNRSLPQDRSRFLSGELALYFGYGSELESLEKANPNLNFDMTVVPQGRTATIKRGYGKFYGFAIPLASPDKNASYEVAIELSNQENGPLIATSLGMSPTQRSVLAQGAIDPFQAVRQEAALTARGWLEPSSATGGIFKTMVEDITSGRLQVSDAVADMAERLRLAF